MSIGRFCCCFALAAVLVSATAPAADRIPVVATFSVIADMLANVGGNRLDIKIIVRTILGGFTGRQAF